MSLAPLGIFLFSLSAACNILSESDSAKLERYTAFQICNTECYSLWFVIKTCDPVAVILIEFYILKLACTGSSLLKL